MLESNSAKLQERHSVILSGVFFFFLFLANELGLFRQHPPGEGRRKVSLL